MGSKTVCYKIVKGFLLFDQRVELDGEAFVKYDLLSMKLKLQILFYQKVGGGESSIFLN